MELIQISHSNISQILKKTAKLIALGEVICIPTETVYGLCCDANNPNAIEKIIKIKKRSPQKQLPIFIADYQKLEKITIFNHNAKILCKKFWPGPLTIVLKKKHRTLNNKYFGETLACRCPEQEFCKLLMKYSNLYIAATSANISGQIAAHNAQQAAEFFSGNLEKPALLIDNGTTKLEKHSTIVDCTEKTIKILRKGAIDENIIKQYLPTNT